MKKTILILLIILIILLITYYYYCYYSNRGFNYYKYTFENLKNKNIYYDNIIIYLNEKIKNIDYNKINFPNEIDIVSNGGGFYNITIIGAFFILDHFNINIKRFSGASAGCQVNYFMLNKHLIKEGLAWFMSVAKTINKYPFMRHIKMWKWFKYISKQCSIPEKGTFNCSLTVFPNRYNLLNYKNLQINEYDSPTDVGEILLSSGAIPWFFYNGFYYNYRNMSTIDGGLTNNLPIFRDNKRSQLVGIWNNIYFPKSLQMKDKYGLFFTTKHVTNYIKHGIDTMIELLYNKNRKDTCLHLLNPYDDLNYLKSFIKPILI